MTRLTETTGLLRVLQIVISIISLGLNGRLTADSKSLSSNSNLLSAMMQDSQIFQTASGSKTPSSADEIISSFSSANGPQIVSLVTSSFTTTSHLFLGFAPTLLTLGNVGLISSPRIVSSLGTSIQGVGERLFAFSVPAAELSELVLWFSSFTYQTSSYGSWDCESVDKLMYQYNLTDDTTAVNITNTLGYDLTSVLLGNTVFTNDTEITELFGVLHNLTIANSDLSFTNWNSTNEKHKQELLISLSHNCQMKKASIGISLVGTVLFFLTSGLVATSAIQIYTSSAIKIRSDDSEKRTSNAIDRKEASESYTAFFIVSTFAHLKPSTLNSSDTKERITSGQQGKTVVEVDTELPNHITLTTTTELESIETKENPSDREKGQKTDVNSDGTSPVLYYLRYSRAILLPVLEKK